MARITTKEVEVLDHNNMKNLLEINTKAAELYATVQNQHDKIINTLSILTDSVDQRDDDIDQIKDAHETMAKYNGEVLNKLKEIVDSIESIEKILDPKVIDRIQKDTEDTNKALFKLILLFSSGIFGTLITFIITILQYIKKP